MIALPSNRNLELRSLLGEVLSVSGSRSQISVARKLIFYCRNPNSVKYGSWTNASSKSKVESLAVVTAETKGGEEEAAATKAVLHKFLREQGFSSALATTTIKKSDLFIEHLVSRLCSLKESGCPVGHELTATEISDALVPYLESLLEDYGSNLVDFLENFPNFPAKGLPVASIAKVLPVSSISSSSLRDCKRSKALSIVTGSPDVQPPMHILYLLEFGMDMEQIKRITYKFPEFAGLSLDGKIRPIVEFLLSYGLSNSDVSKILVQSPQLSSLRLSSNIVPTMKFLEKLGVDKRQWRRILCRFPYILGRSRQKIEAIVDFLYEMGLSADGVGRVLSRYPQITGFSVDNNLRPKAEYFGSLGVKVDRLLLGWPEAFSLRIEGRLKPTTEFFLEKGFSKEEFASMVSRYGAIYTCSLSKNLIPKWEFFLTMNYSKEELVKYPCYLGFSFEGRIKPRYAVMKASGVEMSLWQMLEPDTRFAKTLKNKKEKKALADASVAQIYKG